MKKQTFNELKPKIVEAVGEMIKAGYGKEDLVIIFNGKYKYDGNYDKNIVLRYDNLADDVDFIIMDKEVYKHNKKYLG